MSLSSPKICFGINFFNDVADGTSRHSLRRNNPVAFGAFQTLSGTGAEWVGSD
jgi:hypothetical protein